MGATLSGLIPALGSLSFAAPWVLLGLLVLPVLYWLLRVTPPAPKRLRFPPVALLARLTTEERVTAHTPWWLLLLRLLIAALVLVALARPLLDADRSAGTDGPMVLVIDDGWAAAADWDARITAAETLIDKAALDERGVVVLTTAAHPEDQPVDPPSVQTAEQAKATLKALQPKPWFTDRAATLARLSQATLPDAVSTVWLHDGLEDPGLTAGEQAGAAEPETAFQ
ncbi:MAG: BatA domain-containing protein, partial [Rhodospirillaceae bacterium]